MGCCVSAQREPDEDGVHPERLDSPAGGGFLQASQTQTSQASAHRSLHAPASPRSHSYRSGPSSPAAAGPHPAGINERINPPLRQHVWTGRQRPSRSYQGDVAANRKVWTRRSLDRERVAFFETRVSNRAEIWATLREVVDLVRDHNNLEEAQAILDAAGITVPSGDLADGAYDENGNFYPLVEYVVSDPRDITAPESDDDGGDVDSDDSEEERRLEKGKDVDRLPADAIEVKARLSNRGGPEADVKVHIGKSEPVKVLAKRIKQEAGLPETSRVRIAYLGRVLKENRSLEEQNYKVGNMVNALVSEEPTSKF